jgi:hypothetical protein
MAMSGRKAGALLQKTWMADSSDDKGTVEPSPSQNPNISAVKLTPQALISESEPMDVTSTGKAWATEETVDTIGRILYEVDSDQCKFMLY